MKKSDLNIKEIAKEIRAALKKEFSSCKFSIRISRYAGGQSLDIDLVQGPFEAFTKAGEDCRQVNPYYISSSNHFTAEAKKVLERAYAISKEYNYDNSDSMTDYFDVNFYVNMSVGQWNKPFKNA